FFFFFFQAEDGIRDKLVTGVQTCALPILPLFSSPVAAWRCHPERARGTRATRRIRGTRATKDLLCPLESAHEPQQGGALERRQQIGRASCRERGEIWGVEV